MASSATCSYPGIDTIRACRFPFSRGVLPSAFTIYCLPFDGLDPIGPLRLSNDGNEITFYDCAIASASIRKQYDGKWPIWSVTGLDRRWRWGRKTISGSWNERYSDGVTITPNSRKTPGELATLILQQLGEWNFDVSRMPQNVYPRAIWDNVRCDLALDALCEYVACEVVLNWQTNSVEIWPSGVGAGTINNSGEVLPKYRFVPRSGVPSSVQVVCGPSLYQFRLKLQPIGRQSNLQERVLSAVDWGASLSNTESFSFPNLAGSPVNQALALATAWRQYRVVGQEGGSLQVPSCPEAIASTEQYDLKDYLLYTVRDVNGNYKKLPYYIEGDFWPYSDLSGYVSGQIYVGPSTLYAERQIVEFPYPIVKTTSSGALDAQGATLYLQAAYGVRSTNGLYVRVVRSTNLGGYGGQLTLQRPEIYAGYASTGNSESLAIAEADAYLSIFAQKYQNRLASEITYPGIIPGSLDGKLAQITWSFSIADGVPTTTVCEHEELDTYALSAAQRRRMLLTERLA